MTRRLKHLTSFHQFNPLNAERDMLQRLPIAADLQLFEPQQRLKLERAARLQQLLHFCVTGGTTKPGTKTGLVFIL